MPDLDIKDAHPKLKNLYEFWSGKRAGRRMPSRTDFDTVEFAPWMGNLSLIDVVDGGRDFYYRVHGTLLVNYLGRDLTGGQVTDLAPDQIDLVMAEYRNVLATSSPQFVSRPHINGNREFLRTDKLMLPLAHDGLTVTMIMVGLYSWHGRLVKS